MDGPLPRDYIPAGFEIERLPPANVEAEQALLGALLVNNKAYQRVVELLRPEYFSEAVHGRIYSALARMIDHGSTANPVTLKGVFDQDEALTAHGGAKYLVKLAMSVVTIVNSEEYARTIVEMHQRREIIDAADRMANAAFDISLDMPIAAVVEEAEQRLYALHGVGNNGGGPVPMADALSEQLQRVDAAYKAGGRLPGISTGLTDLDHLIGGLQKSLLIVLAGRPSMGKSALAGCIAWAASQQMIHEQLAAANARAKPPVIIIFSPEMPKEGWAGRWLARDTGIATDRQDTGRLEPHEMTKLLSASDKIGAFPVMVDDTSKITATQVRQRVMRIKRTHGVCLVIVDHMHLMGSSRDAIRQGETAEITERSGGLKQVAKDCKVPVLALAQLNRASESRDDRRPTLADLRGSGSIEQDADVVLFVHRDEYYLGREEPKRRPGEGNEKFTQRQADWSAAMLLARNRADVIIAKNRMGRIGVARAYFDGERSLFNNLDRWGNSVAPNADQLSLIDEGDPLK